VSDVVLHADGICKAFGERSVLKSAALWARAGTITLLLGRNGSGKTTLMKIAAGLLRADQGVVHTGGVAHERPKLHRLARAGVFFLPERGLLLRSRTVGDQLDMVARQFGRDDVRARVIEEYRLASLLDQLPDTLSGGETRRVELGVAALRAPTCLIADEPFMGIAPKDSEGLAAALRSIAAEGSAVVISGHEVHVLLDLADEVVWVAGGMTRVLGTPAEARAQWQFQREYLGVHA
jgi:ABC-type multidrug transport system ATPase subunit